MPANCVKDYYGSNVFNDAAMMERLPKETYKSLMKTIKTGACLDESSAQVIANAMKDWAVEKGATHYTHWFQPMTGITAEKHDAFISPTADGKVILEFSAKELIRGEPDASSFPSGGLRATFEARGYTAWDPTSYAFVKDGTLYIPTVFCSYSGQILDKKTPLLRSMEALSHQAVRVLRLLGDTDTVRVIPTVGAEQEYFLIDKKDFEKREDIILAGRTLFGARPPKGQEMEDHYFGSLRERVSAFMKELDEELWKLGVYAKTKHNEVAPAQHELAPIFTTVNLATDHNQLTMEMMKKIAPHHGLVCLLHEKPFAGVNGSGKHNNWSLSTDKGKNLLSPGKHPAENKRFLLFLAAIIQAVDEYADLMRISVATAGNDHRLGANEAPPAIVSIFLGDELAGILEAVEKGTKYTEGVTPTLETGVISLPKLYKDTTDRNRTSPFAFTGNKFEFRMAGSSQSIAGINTVLNTAVADVLSQIAKRLEAAADPDAEVIPIVRDIVGAHKRIIFNGNNYAEEWVLEAGRRGLLNLRTTVDAAPYYIAEKNIALYARHGIYTSQELHSRYEVKLEEYVKTVNIEALAMLEIVKKDIAPACLRYSERVFAALAAKRASGLPIKTEREQAAAIKLSDGIDRLFEKTEALEKAENSVPAGGAMVHAVYYRDAVIPAMNELRAVADELEMMVDRSFWPMPAYSDILFYL